MGYKRKIKSSTILRKRTNVFFSIASDRVILTGEEEEKQSEVGKKKHVRQELLTLSGRQVGTN